MTVVKQAMIELLLLTVASVGVALAANQIRERKSIELTKNQFERRPDPKRVATDKAVPGTGTKPGSNINKPIPTPDTPAIENSNEEKKKTLDHDYQTVTVDQAHEVLDDPGTSQGLNIFVDARDEENFAEGHIPGAIQCFPYEIHRCLDRVTDAAGGAAKVIVYCGGGDCEDSIFMARELVEAGVPYDAIYLFEGGWKEWSAKGLHTETGIQ